MLFVITLFFATAFAETEAVEVRSNPTYETDSVVYAAGHRVRLRAEGDVASNALAAIGLADPLTVLGAGEAWVQVRTATGQEGYVSRELLTPTVVLHDLDDDGFLDKIVATLGAEGEVIIRTSVGEVTTRFRLETHSRSYVRLSVLDIWEAGVPMLKIETQDRQACGDSQVRYFLSYQDDQLRQAISEYESSDAPYYGYESVAFLPTSRTAVKTRASGDHYDDVHQVEVEILKLEHGVYMSRSKASLDVE